MDFAADAVFDVIAPPPRAANAKTAPAPKSEGPSFDDHLEAQTEAPAAAAPVESAPSSADEKPPAETADAPEATDTEFSEAATPPATDAAAAQAIAVQMIASAPVVTAQASVAKNADAEIKPSSDVPEAVAPADASEDAPAEPTSVAPVKNADGEKTDGAPQDSTAQKNVAAPQTAPTLTPAVNAAAQQAAQATAPIAEQAVQATAPPAPMQVAPTPTREATARTDKSAPVRGDAKVETPEFKPAADPQAPVVQKDGNKSAPSPAASKDGAAAQPVTINVGDAAPAAAGITTSAAPAAQAAQTQNAAIDQATARAAPAGAQVAHEIVRRFDGETTKFAMRLDPPELGRVEVKLEVSRDHKVTAVVTADSPQALTELARQARELTQQLQSAGLELSDNGLTFDLRQGQHERDHAETGENGRSGGDAPTEEAQPLQASAARPLGFERWRGVRVDVTI